MSFLVKRLQSLKLNICFGLLFAFLMLLPDFIFQAIYRSISYSTDIVFILALIVFGTALSLSGIYLFSTIMFLGFVAQLIQLFHIGYFGRPINPTDISKIWREFGDVYASGIASFGELWFIPVILLGCMGILYWLFVKHKKQFGYSSFAVLVVIIALSINTQRAFRKSLKSFLPSPSRYSLHNSLNSFSFWAVKGWKIHNAKDLLPENFYKEYSVVPFTSKAKEPQLILLIMGESTSSTQMSIFSSREATTPNLEKMRKDADFMALPAISSAVCTHASLPLFFNLVREPGNIRLLESEKANLFRLAKAAGYETHFISAQNALLTHALGTAYIDDLRTVEDEEVGFGLKKDSYFFEILKNIMQKGIHKKFIVFNFKAIHSPYASVYADHPEFKVSPTDLADHALNKSNEYKNAMRYLDTVLCALLEEFKTYDDGSGVFVMVSDHGENLGEDNLWGHNVPALSVAQTPFLLYSRQMKLLPKQHIGNKKSVTHYEIGKFLANVLGDEIINPNEDGLSYIQGNDLYQDYDFLGIERDPNGNFFCKFKSVVGELVNRKQNNSFY
jgi:glucan phosphoethanolaminetransferase (alkaline phosphatase superfamily)